MKMSCQCVLHRTISTFFLQKRTETISIMHPSFLFIQKWDEGLANKAQEHAIGCVFKSNSNVTRSNGDRTGETIYYVQDPMASKTSRQAIIEAVQTWYDDQPGQNYLQVSRLLMELRDSQ